MLKQFSYLRTFPNYFLIEYFVNQERHAYVDPSSMHDFAYCTEYIILSEYIFNNSYSGNIKHVEDICKLTKEVTHSVSKFLRTEVKVYCDF